MVAVGSADRVELVGRRAAGGVRILQAHAVGVEQLCHDGLLLDLVAVHSTKSRVSSMWETLEDGKEAGGPLRSAMYYDTDVQGRRAV